MPISERLDTLNLAYNQIIGLENLENAPNMTVIDLHNNKLKKLPDSVLNLMNLKTLKISNNELSDINPRLALMEDLVRINIEGNPLRSIKPAMRNAGAVQLKKYLKMKLDDNEVAEGEAAAGAARNIPNSTLQNDHWDTLLREFRQGTSLDLRNRQIDHVSPKLWAYTDLTVLDLS